MLWPASRESQARTNLRQLLHNLKRALPPECNSLVIDSFHGAVAAATLPASVDTVDFQAAIAAANAARAEKDRAREIQSLSTAAQLYEDDLLPALYDDWLTPVREDYRRLLADALQRLAMLFEEQEEYAAAIPWADRLVALDSLERGEPSIADPATCGQP